MIRRSAAFAALSLSAVLLSGCAIGTVGVAERVSDGSIRDATRYMDQARQPMPPARTTNVSVNDGVWTTGSARRSDHGAPLPRQWERPAGFNLSRSVPMQLFEIGTEITGRTGIPVSFAPDLGLDGAAAGAAPAAAAAALPGGRGPGGPPDINAMLGSMGLAPTAPGTVGGNLAGASGNMIRPVLGTRTAMKVDSYSGPLSQFMNLVAAHFNASWEFSGGEIRMFRNVTRTYTVHALPSTIDLNSRLSADSTTSGGGGGEQSGGATGGSSQAVTSKVNVEIWKDISTAVTSIVGSYGTVTTAVSTGTITVNAPPQIISRVQSYLDGQNGRLNKQVTVSVQVLNVSITDTDSYNLNVQGVLDGALQAGSRYGVTLASPTTAIPAAAGALGFSIAQNSTSRFAGSSAVINALSSAGRVTVRTTASVTTLNGVPAPLQVANTRGYVKDVSVSDGTTTGSSTSTQRTQINTSTVTTGFSLSLLPRVEASGDGLLLQFGINISELNGANNGFDDFRSEDGSQRVQLPNINSRNFVQQARIPNGATLVLSGFEQVNNSGDRSGVGHPGFLGLGGGQNGRAERNVVVILMTPTVLSNQTPLVTAE